MMEGVPAEVIVVRRLSARTGQRTRRAIDRILEQAKRPLVGSDGHLALAEERLTEADEDRTRILLFARLGARAVGVLDALLHVPAPSDLTIAQIAVRKDARRRGIASALVSAALSRARRRAPVSRVLAAVRAGNQPALDFWESLGLDVLERGGSVLLSAAAADLTVPPPPPTPRGGGARSRARRPTKSRPA